MHRHPPRIHLLPARAAPLLVVIARVRAKLFHILRVDVRTGAVEPGSWFRGKIYAKRCDVSSDGHWLVYLAMGADGSVWNGISRAPGLRTIAQADNAMGTWLGGGVFSESSTMLANGWADERTPAIFAEPIPFRIQPWHPELGNAEDLGPLYRRLQRDGYERAGDDWGKDVSEKGSRTTCVGDEGWVRRPTKAHPTLRLRYAGYERGYRFAFSVDGAAIDMGGVEWACWDAMHRLWLARQGCLEQYDARALRSGEPSRVIDLSTLEPPLRRPAPAPVVPTVRRVGAARKRAKRTGSA